MSDVPEGATNTVAIDVWAPFGFVSEQDTVTATGGGMGAASPQVAARWHCGECSVDLASAAKTRKHFAVQHLDYAPYGCAFAGCTVARFCRRKLADHVVAHRHGPRHSFRYDEHLAKRTRLAHMVRGALVTAGADMSLSSTDQPAAPQSHDVPDLGAPGSATHLATPQSSDIPALSALVSTNHLATPQSSDIPALSAPVLTNHLATTQSRDVVVALQNSATQAVTAMCNETAASPIWDAVSHADSPAGQPYDTLPLRSTPIQSSVGAAVACPPPQIDTNNQPQQNDTTFASIDTTKTEIDEQETVDIETHLLEKRETLAETHDASSTSTLSHLTPSLYDDLDGSVTSDSASTRELPMSEDFDQENDVSAHESICTAASATLNSTSTDAALLDLFSPTTQSQSVIMATPAAWAGMTVEVLPNGVGYVMLFPEEGECVHGRGCMKRPCQEAAARSRRRLPVPAAVEAEAVHVVRKRLDDTGRTATTPKMPLAGQLLHLYALRIIEYFELPCPGPARPARPLTTRPPRDCRTLEDFALMQPEPVATAYAMAVRHMREADPASSTVGASTDLLAGLPWDDQLRAFRRAIASTRAHFRHQLEPLRAPALLRERDRRRRLQLNGGGACTEQAENTVEQPPKKKRRRHV